MQKKTIITISIAIAIIAGIGVFTTYRHWRSYDENSWKSIISDNCMTYFDGCNIVNRGPTEKIIDGQVISFPERPMKYCLKYQRPYCKSYFEE
jgi:hypothetical protein